MSLNDGVAYRQPHPCSTGLRGVEGVEDSIEMRRINAGPRIADSHEGSLASSRFGGFISKNRIPARALLRAVAIGCRIS
jgi:hypothetical protein